MGEENSGPRLDPMGVAIGHLAFATLREACGELARELVPVAEELRALMQPQLDAKLTAKEAGRTVQVLTCLVMAMAHGKVEEMHGVLTPLLHSMVDAEKARLAGEMEKARG